MNAQEDLNLSLMGDAITNIYDKFRGLGYGILDSCRLAASELELKTYQVARAVGETKTLIAYHCQGL